MALLDSAGLRLSHFPQTSNDFVISVIPFCGAKHSSLSICFIVRECSVNMHSWHFANSVHVLHRCGYICKSFFLFHLTVHCMYNKKIFSSTLSTSFSKCTGNVDMELFLSAEAALTRKSDVIGDHCLQPSSYLTNPNQVVLFFFNFTKHIKGHFQS